jgi:DDE superfamily endonuclease
MPSKLNTMEQLLLWLLYISDNGVKALKLIFGLLHRTTIVRIADHISHCINTELSDLISWPSAEERKCLYGMLSICDTAIAVLDGTHCEIREPTHDERVYYSGYKHKHTQNYLVCVNVLGIVIHVEGPFPGRMNDRGAYNKSELGQHPERFFSKDERVLADGGFVGGYPLLVPIHSTIMDATHNEKTKEEMKAINSEFTENRLLVEDVFSWIKGRAHVLDSRWKRQRESQAVVFYAACRLHNFVRIHRISYAMKK